jgi:outer membrane protein OmpA-like peptidoglycan-associated protein
MMRSTAIARKGLKTIGIAAMLLCICVQAQAQLKRANRKFDRFLYSEAIPLYGRYLKKNPENYVVVERMADTYRLMNDSQNAEAWFAKAVKNVGGRPENLLYYGQALMNNKNWNGAVPWLEKYVAAKPDDQIGIAALKSAKNYRNFMLDSTLYVVRHLDINTVDADFGTAYDTGAVYYASAKRQDRFIFGWTGRPFLDLYRAPIDGLKLGEPKAVKGKVNSRYHEGGQTLSADRNVMFFSRNNYDRGKVGQSKEGVIRLKTFRADFIRGRWKKVKGIPFNSSEYSVGHPALTPDGKLLYFVSDMPGGLGGTDIYAVNLDIENRTWGKPVNLGPNINTKGNEMFPWISPEGFLYFASNGLEGLGGLDIFVAKNLATSTEYVKNIGYPINSPKDDFALILDSRNGNGFFSSNRVGGTGDDDIYGFTKKKSLKGIVVDAVTGEPIEDARFELFQDEKFVNQARTSQKGEVVLGIVPNDQYRAIASKEGYKQAELPVNARGTTIDNETVVRIPLEKVKADCDPTYTLLGTVHNDDGKLLPGTKVKIMTKEYIVVADENGEIHADLAPNQDYQVVVDAPGRNNKVYDVTTKGVPPGSEVPVDINLNELDSGRVFYIIYYNFDKHDIRPDDARPELDRVVRFMTNNPDVKVELTSHTDCRATDEYNVRLSKNRAIEAYTYIVAHGVQKDRLTYAWKGEKQLTNECADGVECSEVAHQLNRRTEFRLNGYYKVPK